MSFLGDQRQYLATEKSHPGVFLFSGLSYFYECSPRAAVPWLLLAPPTPQGPSTFVQGCLGTTDAGEETQYPAEDEPGRSGMLCEV